MTTQLLSAQWSAFASESTSPIALAYRPLKNARYTHVYSGWEVLSEGEPEIHSGGLDEYNQTCTAYAEF